MKLEEYVAYKKNELDKFEDNFKYPDDEMDEDDWDYEFQNFQDGVEEEEEEEEEEEDNWNNPVGGEG